jgi:hypothetical protein
MPNQNWKVQRRLKCADKPNMNGKRKRRRNDKPIQKGPKGTEKECQTKLERSSRVNLRGPVEKEGMPNQYERQ